MKIEASHKIDWSIYLSDSEGVRTATAHIFHPSPDVVFFCTEIKQLLRGSVTLILEYLGNPLDLQLQ